ncbi:MAG: N(4)-(beta-N-acetylglucosaminyl)-L-asparaginase [Planctomycetaceae bacterium]|jgi:N4-(beta-N-acetylglucosaminyl)-L-asparaginase|nr:N(4)-(beta-N-acetylglucosaminyl)-L-asparaginase [Planctomycetaceae bacterium]
MQNTEYTPDWPLSGPAVLSTWSFGRVANAAAWETLCKGGSPLDAAVAGASAVEDDPRVDSVGVGGLPDASGRVSLDACVMENPDRCGGVCYVRSYASAARLARRVMEDTIHVLLAGDGAEAFAKASGFVPHAEDLLTGESRDAYARWKAERAAAGGRAAGAKMGVLPPMNVEERYAQAGGEGSPEPSHDTVCVLVRNPQVSGHQLAGVCTTSGLGFKIPGRVGDSPIIGHGLYVDQTAGAATATGNGELIMGVCGSFLAVELMRQGRTPAEAVGEVLRRVASRYAIQPEHQVAMIALRADGAWASGSLRPGFSHCLTTGPSLTAEPAHSALAPAGFVLLPGTA